MKFRRTPATIAIYFFFNFLWMTLFIHASENKITEITTKLDNVNNIIQEMRIYNAYENEKTKIIPKLENSFITQEKSEVLGDKIITLDDLQGEWINSDDQYFTVDGTKIMIDAGGSEIKETKDYFVILDWKLKKQSTNSATLTWNENKKEVLWYRMEEKKCTPSSQLQQDKIEWFDNFDHETRDNVIADQGTRDSVVTLLNQAIEKYNDVLNEDVVKDMEEKFGIISQETENFYEFIHLENLFAESDLPVVISRGDRTFCGFGNTELYHSQQGDRLKIKKHEILSNDIIKITAMLMENNQEITFLTQESTFNDFFERMKARIDWFDDLDQRDKDNATQFLSQGIHHYNGLHQDLLMDMETKFGIIPAQTQQLYEFLYSKKNKKTTNEDRYTALQLVLGQEDKKYSNDQEKKDVKVKLIEFLMKNDQNKIHYDSLHEKITKLFVKEFGKRKHEKLIEYVMEDSEFKETAVLYALQKKDKEILSILWNVSGEEKNKQLNNFLMEEEKYSVFAKEENKEKRIQFLMKDVNDYTVLHFASKNEHEKIAKLLLDKLSKKNKELLLEYKPSRNGEIVKSLFNVFILEENQEKRIEFLMQEDKNKKTILHHASECGDDEIVKILLNAFDEKYKEYLIQYVMKENCYKGTALHNAAQKGHGDIINSLLNVFGKDTERLVEYVMKKNEMEYTSSDLAFVTGHNKIANLLTQETISAKINQRILCNLHKVQQMFKNSKYTGAKSVFWIICGKCLQGKDIILSFLITNYNHDIHIIQELPILSWMTIDEANNNERKMFIKERMKSECCTII